MRPFAPPALPGFLATTDALTPVERFVQPFEPASAYNAPRVFQATELERVLKWADVKRDIRTGSPQFECVLKHSPDGRRLYVAVFRRWPGSYDNIWYDDVVERRWGRRAARVHIAVSKDGEWRIEPFHRTRKQIGVVSARNRTIEFQTGPLLVGELALFRVTRGDP